MPWHASENNKEGMCEDVSVISKLRNKQSKKPQTIVRYESESAGWLCWMSGPGHTHDMRAHSSVCPVQPGGSDGLGWALSHIWGLVGTTELIGLCSFLQPASPGVLQRVEKQGRDQKHIRIWRHRFKTGMEAFLALLVKQVTWPSPAPRGREIHWTL